VAAPANSETTNMKSTAHVKGHPIHPMLIPYPFALLSSAVVFDIGARTSRRSAWSATARHLTVAGLGSALVAAIPGVIDYFGSVPRGTRARRYATAHALLNVSALACFAVAHRSRQDDGRLPAGGLTLAVIGTGLLSGGGWLGGELVYHQHVAVVEQPGSALLTAAPGGASNDAS
jgi:uncharacterized membrane protein